MQLFCALFCVVRAVRKLDLMLLINKNILRRTVIELSPRPPTRVLRECPDAVQGNYILLGKKHYESVFCLHHSAE